MKKSIFLFFAAILCAIGMNAAVPSKLYLDASGWGYGDARYAAYFMPQNSFVDMTKVTGEVSLFEVAVPASQTQVIFVRMNGSKPANDWTNKWNKTGDLTIPTDGKNKFKPSKWDDATTTWSTYTPPTFYIAGDFVTPNWNPAAAANKMDYADGVYSKSYNNVAASAHQFKITNGGWDGAIGYNQNTCSGTNCTVENGGGNIKFTPLAEGTVTITYTLADGKVHITCPEPPVAEFNITYPATQTNYTLVAGPAKAQTSAEVSFTATPAEGYVLNVTYNGNVITGENNVYTFMMPASDVTIAITAVTATTLYYVDNSNWGNANAYMWSDHGDNGWPGAAMTSVGTVGDNAYSYYSISFAQGAYTSIIFNNGSGSQTGDLTINTAKPYFYDGAWYTWDELLAKLAAPVVTYDYYITGSFNGNNPKKAENGMTLDGTVYKATVTLAAGDNMLKVTDGTWDNTWGYDQLGAAYEEVSNPNDYNNIKITLTAEKSITVIFDATAGKITFEGLTLKRYTVEATVNPVEAGTIEGAGTYNHGAEATLTATPAAGYHFVNWTVGGKEVSAKNPYDFTVTENVDLIANFAKNVYTVKVTAENGTVTGDGEYTHGEQATLTATADEGYEFVNWTKDEEVVTENPYKFTVTANVDLVANFKEAEPEYNVVEDEITNLMIDMESMCIIGGPSAEFGVDVFLALTEQNQDGTWALSDESSVAIQGVDATFIDGYAYDIDVNAPAVKVVLHVEFVGSNYELQIDMTSKPVVIEIADAIVSKEEYPDGMGGTYTNWTMDGQWSDGETTYPVLVDMPAFDPTIVEADMMVTIQIGSWLDVFYGAAEGLVHATVAANVVTLTGTLTSYTAGTWNINISGTLPAVPSALDNLNTTVAPVKMIENGQLIIVKDGVQYNAQGAILK